MINIYIIPQYDSASLDSLLHCVYIFMLHAPTDSFSSVTGEAARPLAARPGEHRHNPKECFLEKTKLIQHA
jgi:hypothetical protein